MFTRRNRENISFYFAILEPFRWEGMFLPCHNQWNCNKTGTVNVSNPSLCSHIIAQKLMIIKSACFQHSLSCFNFTFKVPVLCEPLGQHVCWKNYIFAWAYRIFTQEPHVSPVPRYTSEPLLPQNSWLSSSWNETEGRRRIPVMWWKRF